MSPVFLAVDLGAGSGRVMAAIADPDVLSLEEVHRFDNPGTDLPGGSYWNPVGLFREILEGLQRARQRYGGRVVAVGIDTWGCDHALLDAHGVLLELPHQYRDARSAGMAERMHVLMPERAIYHHTGIRTLFYNTSVHLLAAAGAGSTALAHARTLLFMPDLLNYWRTIASTSQLIDPRSGDWAREVIGALGLPQHVFGPVVAPGTVLGPLRAEVCRETGMGAVPVIATASHDAAAAVAGIPMEGEDALWLSSGTWSILGLQTRAAITGDEAFALGFCNELGVDGTVRFLKNIAGLWLIQECKRQWALDGEDLDYGELAALAAAAEPFTAFVDPDVAEFAVPGGMPDKIREFCRRSGQAVPEDKGTILRVATESLALKYRVVYDRLCAMTGRVFPRLHAGGGGIQNELLSQATANALGIEVVAGPVEATSLGNVITQMIATGHLTDYAAGRELIRRSFGCKVYEPVDGIQWSAAMRRFAALIA